MKFAPPRYASAAQVQAEFYRQALEIEPPVSVYLEYGARTARGKRVRFDAVVVHNEDVIAIVVCKRSENAGRKPTAQLQRYQTLGNCPVLVIRGLDRVPAAVGKVARLCDEQPAVLPDFDAAEMGLGDEL